MRVRLSLGVLVFVASFPARADWSIARHDPQRTGFVPGSTNLTSPEVGWQYYLGGSLASNQWWAGSVNDGGEPVDGGPNSTVIYASGGRVVAKLLDDTLLWATPPLGVTGVVDVFDINGDGVLDVIAAGSPAALAIFSAADGSLEWSLPATSGIGTIGAIRTADLTGTGKRDLYVAGAGCGAFPDTSAGVAYAFSGAFSTAQKLWSIPLAQATGCGGNTDLIADISGAGNPQVVRLSAGVGISVFNGSNGHLAFSTIPDGGAGNTGPLTFGGAGSGLLATPPIGDGGALLIYFDNSFNGATSVGGKLVTGYEYSPAQVALVKAWDFPAGNTPASDELVFDGKSLGHFDDGGAWEVAFSNYNATAATWTLEILSATTGASLGAGYGMIYEGSAPLDLTGIPQIVTYYSGGYQSVGFHSPALKTLVTAAGPPITIYSRALSQTNGLATELAVANIGGPALLVEVGGKTYEAENMTADLGTGNAVATYSIPAGTKLSASQLFPLPGPGNYLQPFLSLSSGYLVALAPVSFSPLNADAGPTSLRQGLRTGGYYSGGSDIGFTPAVAVLQDGGHPSVVVADSNHRLVRLDPAETASVAVPPVPIWSLPNAGEASLIPFGGARHVVVESGGAVCAYPPSSVAKPLWCVGADAGNVLDYDLPYGDALGNGVEDIFYEQTVAGKVVVNLVNGADGGFMWPSAPGVVPVVGVSPMAVGRLLMDGGADAILDLGGLITYSGLNGDPLFPAEPSNPYAEPLVANIENPLLDGGLPEIFLNGGGQSATVYGPHGGLWWDDDAGVQSWAKTYAALAPCPSGSIYVEAVPQSSTLVGRTALTGAKLWQVQLASGAEYADDGGPLPTGVVGGFLGNVTVKQDLTGAGDMDALVGSTDGYLYAVRACSNGVLEWTHNFGAAVGEPVVADATGSGKDQILVSVGDGYLYGLFQPALAAPAQVYMTDPPGGSPNTQVSTIHTASTLYAQATAVPQATSYEFGVFMESGLPAGDGGLQMLPAPAAGGSVNFVADNLSLVDGGTYFFDVRAVDSAGVSQDMASNLVTVLLSGGTATNTSSGTGVGPGTGSTSGTGVGSGSSGGASGGFGGAAGSGSTHDRVQGVGCCTSGSGAPADTLVLLVTLAAFGRRRGRPDSRRR